MPSNPQRLISRDDLVEVCLLPGDVIDGRYVIERILGEGTFAWVYLARHATIETLQCAIKVLKPHFIGDEELRAQFRHEAETVARLRDLHTVRVSDMGELGDGRPYICMEYCVGATLDRIIPMFGPQSDIMVAHFGRGVLHSLREAHSLGIVHRDIKPSNISLSEDTSGTAPLTRVLDFGIAYVAQVQGARTESADSDLVFCTPSYAAPEVLRGNISAAADLYALGLTLAELIEGEPVFPNTGFYTVAARQMANEPVPFGPRTLASKLLPFLQKACEKDLQRRFQSASEMLEALDEISEELDHSQMLTWQHFAPQNCVGKHRCSLATDRLDMALPAGCANGQCNASRFSNAPELRIRPADDSADGLASSIESQDSFGAFLTAEFTDVDTVPHAEPPSAMFRPFDVHEPTGTLRIPRVLSDGEDDLLMGGPSVSRPLAETHPLTARYRHHVESLMQDILPKSPHFQRHALLIANTIVVLILMGLFTTLLFRGLP